MAQAREHEEALIEAIDAGKTGQELPDGLSYPPPLTEGVHTVRIDVDGEETECVDIEGLAQILGTSLGALQKRGQRGDIQFTMHEGIRHYPLDARAQLQAALMTHEQIADELGVSTKTIQRWKKQAPSGLSRLEMVEFLRNKAGKRPRSDAVK